MGPYNAGVQYHVFWGGGRFNRFNPQKGFSSNPIGQALGVLEEMRAKGHSPELEKLDLAFWVKRGARHEHDCSGAIFHHKGNCKLLGMWLYSMYTYIFIYIHIYIHVYIYKYINEYIYI